MRTTARLEAARDALVSSLLLLAQLTLLPPTLQQLVLDFATALASQMA
jgi:hypothetical protein